MLNIQQIWATMPAPGVCLNILSERNLKDGQGSPNNPEKFLDQDFHQLKKFCLKERLRFVDNLFPPKMKSLGLGSLTCEDLQRVVWRRPHVREHLHTQTTVFFLDLQVSVWSAVKCKIIQLFPSGTGAKPCLHCSRSFEVWYHTRCIR